MNIIQQSEMLKDISDDRIKQEMQQPTGQFPLYLVSSEAKRRSDMRQRFKAEADGPPPTSTVQQDLMASLAAQTQAPGLPPGQGNQGIMGQQPSPSGPANIQPTQQFAGGGQVRGFQEGGRTMLTPPEEYQPGVDPQFNYFTPRGPNVVERGESTSVNGGGNFDRAMGAFGNQSGIGGVLSRLLEPQLRAQYEAQNPGSRTPASAPPSGRTMNTPPPGYRPGVDEEFKYFAGGGQVRGFQAGGGLTLAERIQRARDRANPNYPGSQFVMPTDADVDGPTRNAVRSSPVAKGATLPSLNRRGGWAAYGEQLRSTAASPMEEDYALIAPFVGGGGQFDVPVRTGGGMGDDSEFQDYNRNMPVFDDFKRNIPPRQPTTEEIRASQLAAQKEGLDKSHAGLTKGLGELYTDAPTPGEYNKFTGGYTDPVSEAQAKAAQLDFSKINMNMPEGKRLPAVRGFQGTAFEPGKISDHGKLSADKLALLRQEKDPYAAVGERLDARGEKIEDASDMNTATALMLAGAKIAGTPGNVGQALSAGAETGLNSFVRGQKDITRREESLEDARTSLVGLQEKRKSALQAQADKFATGQIDSERYTNSQKQIEHDFAIKRYQLQQTGDIAARREQQMENEAARVAARFGITQGQAMERLRAENAQQQNEGLRRAAKVVAEQNWKDHLIGIKKSDQAFGVKSRNYDRRIDDTLRQITRVEKRQDNMGTEEQKRLDRENRIWVQKLASGADTPLMKNAKAAMADPNLAKAMVNLSVGPKARLGTQLKVGQSWHRTLKSVLGDSGELTMPKDASAKEWGQLRKAFVADLAGDLAVSQKEAEYYADVIIAKAKAGSGAQNKGAGTGLTRTKNGRMTHSGKQ